MPLRFEDTFDWPQRRVERGMGLPVAVRLPRDVVDALESAAESEGVTISCLVERAVRRDLGVEASAE